MTWKWTIVSLVVIVVVAIFLRTYNILSIPIFADEAIYVRWAQVMKAEPTLRFLPQASEGKQPLFMWTTMLSLGFLNDPLLVGRMISVFTGVFSLLGIFLLTHRLFNSKNIALIAALFYAVSPFSVFFDRMALVDSMLTAFGVWSLYFGVLAAQTRRIDLAMLTGFTLGAAWLTKSPGVFFLFLLPTTGLMSFWPKSKSRFFSHGIRLLGLWGISWFIAFVMYNILRLGPGFEQIGIQNKKYLFGIDHIWTSLLNPFTAHVQDITNWFLLLLPGTVLIMFLLGGILAWKKSRPALILLLVWGLVPPLFVSELAKHITARYILYAVPPFFILAAVSTAYWTNLLKKLRMSWVLILVLIIPALWINYLVLTNPERAPLPRVERSGYLEEWTAGTGIKEVAEYLKIEMFKNPNSHFVIGTEGFFGTLPDGLQIYFEKVPSITIIGIGVYISDAHPRLVDAKKAGNKVYFVINSDRFTGDAEKEGLRLIKSYPKAARPDGSRQELLFFEVTEDALK